MGDRDCDEPSHGGEGGGVEMLPVGEKIKPTVGWISPARDIYTRGRRTHPFGVCGGGGLRREEYGDSARSGGGQHQQELFQDPQDNQKIKTLTPQRPDTPSAALKAPIHRELPLSSASLRGTTAVGAGKSSVQKPTSSANSWGLRNCRTVARVGSQRRGG